MRTILIAAAVALLGASAPAQTPSNTPLKSSGLGKPEASTNEEMNIRAYIELLRTDIRKSKSQIMGDVMQLDTDQATKFWPVYKDFEGEYSTLGDRVVALIKKYVDNYGNLTDPVADEIATQVLSIEQARNELKKKYYERVKGAVGALVAARFLQVENQLERLVDLQVAAELPVISR